MDVLLKNTTTFKESVLFLGCPFYKYRIRDNILCTEPLKVCVECKTRIYYNGCSFYINSDSISFVQCFSTSKY